MILGIMKHVNIELVFGKWICADIQFHALSSFTMHSFTNPTHASNQMTSTITYICIYMYIYAYPRVGHQGSGITCRDVACMRVAQVYDWSLRSRTHIPCMHAFCRVLTDTVLDKDALCLKLCCICWPQICVSTVGTNSVCRISTNWHHNKLEMSTTQLSVIVTFKV